MIVDYKGLVSDEDTDICLIDHIYDIYLLLILCFQWLNSRGSLVYLSCLDSENQHFSPYIAVVAHNLMSLFPIVIVLPGKGPQGE